MSTAAQIAANQANAQLSTGPKTEAGKAKSAFNAIKTGLTGRTVVLPSEDAAAYQEHISRANKNYDPQTPTEQGLVQAIADIEWRLLRIPSLEAGIYALGLRHFAELFADEADPALRASLIQAHTFMTYRKDLCNLSLQERRLRSQLREELTDLIDIQETRVLDRKRELKLAAAQYLTCQRAGDTFFEISLPEIEAAAAQLRAQREADSASYRSAIGQSKEFLAKKVA